MIFRPSRRALARLIVGACFIALFIVIVGSAQARPRAHATWIDAPTAAPVLPRADDGGRLWRWASGGGQSIVAEAERFLGAGNVFGTRGPWCADYASFVLRKTGHRPLANRMAYSALAYGPHVANPRPGDLVVLPGHVGFVVANQGGTVRIVSGNWGHRVALGTVSRAAVIAFVRV